MPDPNQAKNVMGTHTGEARELHRLLVQFMRETKVPGAFAATPVGTAFLDPLKIAPRRVRNTGAPGPPPSRRLRRLCRTPGPHCSGRDSPGCFISCGSDTHARTKG